MKLWNILRTFYDCSRYQRTEEIDEYAGTQEPKFLGPLKGTNHIREGQNAHFETRLEPLSDPTLQVRLHFRILEV